MFRNYYGGIAWSRVIAFVLIVAIAIASYFLFFQPKKESAPESEAGTPMPTPDSAVYKTGTATNDAYECGEYYCVYVRWNEGNTSILRYPKSYGMVRNMEGVYVRFADWGNGKTEVNLVGKAPAGGSFNHFDWSREFKQPGGAT